jgi:hypothetical protein
MGRRQYNGGKGRDVGGGGSGSKRGDVDAATVGYNQDILIAVNRADGKTTCKVSREPFVFVNGDETALGGRQQREGQAQGGGRGVRYRERYTGGEGGR